jgi:hypothetical protein
MNCTHAMNGHVINAVHSMDVPICAPNDELRRGILTKGATDGLAIRMKTATTVCGRCGARISGDATGKVCPACLLENGLGLFGGESVAGVVDSGRNDNVPVLDGKKAARSAKILSHFGDYELLEEIGRGGQGGHVVLSVSE